MKIENNYKKSSSNRILITTEELKDFCGGCGRLAAIQIGTAAKARVKVGRRVFWSVQKLIEYTNKIAE